MGQLVDGKWEAEGIDPRKSDGKFKRADAAFRNWVTKDGSPGPPARAVSRLSRAATTSMSPMPARGRIAR